MTVLVGKAERDALGIDTFERGFLYAVLLLRANNTSGIRDLPRGQNRHYNAVRIALDLDNEEEESIRSLVSIRVRLPYDSDQSLRGGGSFISSVEPFGDEEVEYNAQPLEPSPEKKMSIATEPAGVDTLEKYLAWTASNIICGYIALNPEALPPMSISLNDSDTENPSLDISAELPIYYGLFLNTGSLLAAVQSVITLSCSDRSVFVPGGDARDDVGNQSSLSNMSTIGN